MADGDCGLTCPVGKLPPTPLLQGCCEAAGAVLPVRPPQIHAALHLVLPRVVQVPLVFLGASCPVDMCNLGHLRRQENQQVDTVTYITLFLLKIEWSIADSQDGASTQPGPHMSPH